MYGLLCSLLGRAIAYPFRLVASQCQGISSIAGARVAGMHLKSRQNIKFSPRTVALANSKQTDLTITTMFWKTIFAVALLAKDATSQNVNVGKLLRFACSQLVIERIDPLVNPGMNPSTHTHQIVGGNSFNTTVRLLLSVWYAAVVLNTSV